MLKCFEFQRLSTFSKVQILIHLRLHWRFSHRTKCTDSKRTANIIYFYLYHDHLYFYLPHSFGMGKVMFSQACPSTPGGGGGYPHLADGGYPIQPTGGGGGYPSKVRMGVPPGRDGGYPSPPLGLLRSRRTFLCKVKSNGHCRSQGPIEFMTYCLIVEPRLYGHLLCLRNPIFVSS